MDDLPQKSFFLRVKHHTRRALGVSFRRSDRRLNKEKLISEARALPDSSNATIEKILV